MELLEFCRTLGFSDSVRCALEPEWEQLSSGWNGVPEFFAPEFFRKYYPFCNGPAAEEIYPALEKMSLQVQCHPALQLFAHILHKGVFCSEPELNVRIFPLVHAHLGELSGLFNFAVALSAAPLMEKSYASIGVPAEYAHNALRWLGGTIAIYQSAHEGMPGFSLQQLPWLHYYIKNELFRIGRLEFLLHTCPPWMPPVYRNKEGKITVLCGDNWRFTADGRRAAADAPDSQVSVTRIASGKDSVTGTPADRFGRAMLGQSVTLDCVEWKPVCTPWDLCPSVHIPGGEKLPFPSVKESFQLALKFFRCYFSREVPFFCCTSWIFNPLWEELMPDSNMADFIRETRAIPSWPPVPRSGMFFLFGRDDVDPVTLEAHNTAQRAMQEASRRRALVYGSMIVLADDIDKLGNQYYRNQE